MMKLCPKCKALNDNAAAKCLSCSAPVAGERKIEDLLAPEDRTRFKITDFVGEGSFGRVYRCHDSKFNRLVALKILKDDCRQNSLTLELFKRECDFSSNIGEEHLVSMLEYRITPQYVYAVMEFVEGVDMNIFIKDLDSMPLSTFRKIAGQIAAGLNFFHYHGLLHCDLKPANIMISPETLKLKIIDLGLSHFKFEEKILDRNMVAGTRGYMSPEQAAGSQAINQASDIYSVGAICYELLTGTLPKFDANYRLIPPSALISIAGEGGETPSQPAAQGDAFKKLAGDLDALVSRCLSPDPKDRFKNAMEFVSAFKKFNLAKEGDANIVRLLKKGRVNLASLGFAHEEPKYQETGGEPSGITAVLENPEQEAEDRGVPKTSKTQLLNAGDEAGKKPAADLSIVSGHREAALESLKKEPKTPRRIVRETPSGEAAEEPGRFSAAKIVFYVIAAAAAFLAYYYLQKPVSVSLAKKSDVCEAGQDYSLAALDATITHTGGWRSKADAVWSAPAGRVEGNIFRTPSAPAILTLEARLRGYGDFPATPFYLSLVGKKGDLTAAYSRELKFGERGPGENQFNGISDISPEREGFFLVADTANSRIVVVDARGKFTRAFGMSGGAGERLSMPSSAALAPDGSVFVTDTGNHRIVKFDAGRACVGKFGRKGSGAGEFDTPTSVACDAEGNLYVVDRGNDRIQKLRPDGSFVRMRGRRGNRPAEFNGPWGVAVGVDGMVYVTDGANGRVQVFNGDLEHVMSVGRAGKGNLEFSAPCSVKCAGDGTVFVTEPENSRIQFFNIKSGRTAIISTDIRLARPTVATPDPSGALYASDADGVSIVKLAPSRSGSK